MADYLGDVPVGVTLEHDLDLFASGVPMNLVGATVAAYKNQSTTQSTAGITFTAGFDGLPGLHHLTVNLAADGTFYAANSQIRFVLTAGALDGASQIGRVLAFCTIELAGGALALAKARLPVLINGRMPCDVEAINDSTEAAQDLRFAVASVVRGAAIAGTLSTTQMTTDLTEVTDNHYNGRIVIWTSGGLKDQATDVSGYLGATKRLTFTATTEAPAVGDTFVLV